MSDGSLFLLQAGIHKKLSAIHSTREGTANKKNHWFPINNHNQNVIYETGLLFRFPGGTGTDISSHKGRYARENQGGRCRQSDRESQLRTCRRRHRYEYGECTPVRFGADRGQTGLLPEERHEDDRRRRRHPADHHRTDKLQPLHLRIRPECDVHRQEWRPGGRPYRFVYGDGRPCRKSEDDALRVADRRRPDGRRQYREMDSQHGEDPRHQQQELWGSPYI